MMSDPQTQRSRRRSSSAQSPDPPPTLLHPTTSSHDDPKRERSRRELSRVTSRRPSRDVGRVEEGEGDGESTNTPTGRSSDGLKPGSGRHGNGSGRRQAWYIRWVKVWGRGMWHDVRNRAPYYSSDWTDAWNYRVVPATLVSARIHYTCPSPRLLPCRLPSFPRDAHFWPCGLLLLGSTMCVQ